MKLVPYHDKIVVKPIETTKIIVTDKKLFHEKGEVLAIGRNVTFCKVGDIIYFDSYGCIETAPTTSGEKYHIVRDHPEFIYGKE